MRFKKGSKVEVMNKEVPASWRVGEIISGNQHVYNVRYDGYQGVEKVSRRFIRPSPPVISSDSWVTGDIVEVFDGISWKIATVSKVLKKGRFLVRPHGFTHETSVYKSNIRSRQSWCDGQWISVGKVSGSYGDMKYGKAVEPSCSMKMVIQAPAAVSKICQEEDDSRLHESCALSKKPKRASPFCSACPQKAKKFKPAEKDDGQRHVSGNSFEKSHNWRHASLASQTRFWFCCLSLGKSSGTCQHTFATDKTVCCHWHLSEQLKDSCGSLFSHCYYYYYCLMLLYSSSVAISGSAGDDFCS